jgi:hypothetical protein
MSAAAAVREQHVQTPLMPPYNFLVLAFPCEQTSICKPHCPSQPVVDERGTLRHSRIAHESAL